MSESWSGPPTKYLDTPASQYQFRNGGWLNTQCIVGSPFSAAGQCPAVTYPRIRLGSESYMGPWMLPSMIVGMHCTTKTPSVHRLNWHELLEELLPISPNNFSESVHTHGRVFAFHFPAILSAFVLFRAISNLLTWVRLKQSRDDQYKLKAN